MIRLRAMLNVLRVQLNADEGAPMPELDTPVVPLPQNGSRT